MVHNYSQQHNHKKTAKVSVGIVGSRGYSGLELAKLLLDHPAVELKYAFATREFSLEAELMQTRARSVTCLTDEHILENLCDVMFLATPGEVSVELAPKIMGFGKTVIDISGAFRLDNPQAEYGLVPFCGPKPNGGKLIANPGCYATAIQLALIPLLKQDLIETEGLVIDAKSGTTGAGRKASETQLFAEVDGECLPYRVGKHQHLPEMQKYIEKYAGVRIEPHFSTHLLPTKKGIVASIYAKSKTLDVREIAACFATEYGNYPLVRHGADYSRLAKLSSVVGTPYTNISYELVGDKLYVFSVLDNLMKGAASQAVENLNRILDLPLTYSLASEA